MATMAQAYEVVRIIRKIWSVLQLLDVMHTHSSADVSLIWCQLLTCLCRLLDPEQTALAFVVITLQDLKPQLLPSFAVVVSVCFFFCHAE
jgi:hypothetical protein